MRQRALIAILAGVAFGALIADLVIVDRASAAMCRLPVCGFERPSR